MFLAPYSRTSLAHFLRGVLISLDDIDVAGAAAQVAGDRVTDFVVAGVVVLLQERVAGHQHSRRAVAALKAVFLKETVLKRMKFAVLFETFDGGNRTPVSLHGEDGARLHGFSVEHDGTRAAVTRVATDMRAREPQRFTEEVDQQQTRFDVGALLAPIDIYFNSNFRHLLGSSLCAVERRVECASGKNANQISLVVG